MSWSLRPASRIRGVVGLAGPYDFRPFDTARLQGVFGTSPHADATQPVSFAVTAVLNGADGKLVVNVVNRSETTAIPADIELQAGEYTGKGQVHLITADSLEATNTAEEEQVRIETTDLKFTGHRISHTFPAHSLTQIEISLKK